MFRRLAQTVAEANAQLTGREVFHFSPSAILHLQYYGEQWLTAMFAAAARLTEHRGHTTVNLSDLSLLNQLRIRPPSTVSAGVGVVRFSAYISRLISSSNMRGSKNYSSQLGQFLNCLARRIISEANFLIGAELRQSRTARRHTRPKRTIGQKELLLTIQNLHLRVSPDMLVPRAVADRLFRLHSAARISTKATEVLRQILSSYLTLLVRHSAEVAKTEGRKTLSSRHLALVMRDPRLSSLAALARTCQWAVLD
jgi:histone H3/H4